MAYQPPGPPCASPSPRVTGASVALPVMLSEAVSLQLPSEQAVACLSLQPSQDASPLPLLKGNRLNNEGVQVKLQNPQQLFRCPDAQLQKRDLLAAP